jgi:hypothetical protein
MTPDITLAELLSLIGEREAKIYLLERELALTKKALAAEAAKGAKPEPNA